MLLYHGSNVAVPEPRIIMDGLNLFLGSETHRMLTDASLKMWYFSPVATYDMWENEIVTGDPRNSLYIRGDEI